VFDLTESGVKIYDEDYADYRLTLPEEHKADMDYISVSYCWVHEQCEEGLDPTPDYFILSPWKL
jgi:hypothetical protein